MTTSLNLVESQYSPDHPIQSNQYFWTIQPRRKVSEYRKTCNNNIPLLSSSKTSRCDTPARATRQGRRLTGTLTLFVHALVRIFQPVVIARQVEVEDIFFGDRDLQMNIAIDDEVCRTPPYWSTEARFSFPISIMPNPRSKGISGE